MVEDLEDTVLGTAWANSTDQMCAEECAGISAGSIQNFLKRNGGEAQLLRYARFRYFGRLSEEVGGTFKKRCHFECRVL